jgi:DNA-binding transcriptional MerR regulator
MTVGEADSPPVRRAGKSETAFRTISEVADELEVPQHVLRFWEGRFPQIQPLKRGGGRRYYRPDDIALLRRIRDLLYAEGYTIKGVQKLLMETSPPPERPTPVLPTPRPRPAPFTPLTDTAPVPAAIDAAPSFRIEPGDDPADPPPADAIDPATRATLRDLLVELEDLRALLDHV